MKYSAQEITTLLNGKLEGDPAVLVNRLSKIEEGQVGSVSFLANPKYFPYLYTSSASIVIVGDDFVPEKPVATTLIRVKDAYQSFAYLLELYNQIQHKRTGIEQPSFVAASAIMGENVYVGAHAYIGESSRIGNNVKIYPQVFIGENVEIGDNTILFSGVRIYADCIVGANCNIHGGVIIGADGFGFTSQKDGAYKKTAQIGNVIIEDEVEVGANTTIDRATLGSTIIRKGVKLDNLIQIAHNVEIGENTVVAAQVGIAGSAKIGRECMIGGQVGIVGHITIADRVKIAAQSGVGASILNEGEIVQGSPAFNVNDYKRTYVLFKKLPALEKRIRELEQALIEVRQTTLS